MNHSFEDAIRFAFPDMSSAYSAYDTLQELGYRPVLDEVCGAPTLHIHVERTDVQSALEIAQFHGGSFQDTGTVQPDADASEFMIPAHAVNEDFTDGYAAGMSHLYVQDE